MTWLLQEPLYIAILGVVAIAMLGFAWLQTRFQALLYATLAAIVVTGLLLAVEHWVETDAERVEKTLHEIAAAVERNDLPAVMQFAASGAIDARSRLENEFPRYHFERVSIKHNLEVKIDYDRQPAEATATFNVVVVGTAKSLSGRFHVPRFVEVKLVEENGQWRVSDYRHWSPQRHLQLTP